MNDSDFSSDTSDEDFIPEGVHDDDRDDHELGSDDDDNEAVESDESESPKGKKRKQKPTKLKQKKAKRKKSLFADADKEENIEENNDTSPVDEVEQVKKADSLWADFLADVEEKPKEAAKSKPKNTWANLLDSKKSKASSTSLSSSEGNASDTKSKSDPPVSKPSTVKVTKVFEFAGEEVRIEEEVPADSEEAKKSSQNPKDCISSTSIKGPGLKKPAGLSSVLNSLDNKKKKLSTLEKTKLDWMKFKSTEGLEDELQTHLKSKEGFLEKRAFLERADLRQFEIERNMRMSKRTSK